MKHKKLIGLIIGSAFGVAVIVISIVQYISINNQYPSPNEMEYIAGQPVPYRGLEITASKHFFLESSKLKDIFGDEWQEEQDMKCVVVELTVKNISNQEQQAEIYPFMLQSQAWCNGINAGIFLSVNSKTEKPTLAPTLKPDESATVQLTFTMINLHFKQKDWLQVENRNFDLVLSLYPTKQVIHV